MDSCESKWARLTVSLLSGRRICITDHGQIPSHATRMQRHAETQLSVLTSRMNSFRCSLFYSRPANGTFHRQLAPIPVQGVLVGETAYCLSSRIACPQCPPSRPAICAVRVPAPPPPPGPPSPAARCSCRPGAPDRRSLARRGDVLRRCVTWIARTDQSPQRAWQFPAGTGPCLNRSGPGLPRSPPPRLPFLHVAVQTGVFEPLAQAEDCSDLTIASLLTALR